MECNKDEALRAKEIAVRKFTEGNYSGAKKFALKAQVLYPALEGIGHLVTTIDIYISANTKVGGEMDFYGILGINPLIDDKALRRQYRKLLLQIHPDKNKSPGADGAFQFVLDAFSVLSNEAKRSAYNTRRHIQIAQRVPSSSSIPVVPAGSGIPVPQPRAGRAANQKAPTGGVSGARAAEQTLRNQCSRASQQKVHLQSANAAVPPGVNGHYKHPGASSSRGKSPKSSKQKASLQGQSFFEKGETFWTVCARCKMQYEYMRVYLNHMLKCPHCEVGFVAEEIRPPSNLAPLQPEKQQRGSISNSGPHVSGVRNSFGGSSARWSPTSGTTAYHSPISVPAAHAEATNGSQVVKESLKRENEEAQTAGKWNAGFGFSGEGPLKRMREMGENPVRNFGSSIPRQSGTGNIDFSMGNFHGPSKWHSEAGTANGFAKYSVRFNVNRELSGAGVKKLLTEKALVQLRTEVRSSKLVVDEKGAAKEKAKVKETQKSKLAKCSQERGAHVNYSGPQIGSQLKNISIATSADLVKELAPELSVPDPDFHVFDHGRSERCFGENQVWAGYDNDDGMPRFYALIHEVVSLDPFKVRISWLNSRSNAEFDSMDWVRLGFRKTCGDFWVGKYETNDLLNSFSHQVRFDKGPRGVFQIYPREGDIWALYKNWSPDWNRNTPDEVIHAYDMVEVLQDYSSENGVYVASISKAAGFRTVFCKQPDPKVVMHIPKNEMFRFSHQVPHHILTGFEKPNAPKGFVELDPAATPAELLQETAGTTSEQVTGFCAATPAELFQETAGAYEQVTTGFCAAAQTQPQPQPQPRRHE